jgi:L-threonylcarbamoyladenylate synthase
MRDEAVAHAARVLRNGGLVAVPTETVYGLAADARNEAAIRRIFAVKGRPARHPLIVHVASAASLEGWARDVPPIAWELARLFWPGPLTLVLRRAAGVPPLITGGQDTVAVRVPRHPVTLDLLEAFAGGIAAPSANPFGAVSPTRADDVREMFAASGGVDYVLDGGDCTVGVESTILDLSRPRPALLRPGGISRETLESVTGWELGGEQPDAPRVPGQHPRHYSPRAKVTLSRPEDLAASVEAALARGLTVGVIAPQGFVLKPDARMLAVSAPSALEEYARRLYRWFRDFDNAHCDLIFATLPEERGLGSAIADRLRRAAAEETPAQS